MSNYHLCAVCEREHEILGDGKVLCWRIGAVIREQPVMDDRHERGEDVCPFYVGKGEGR